MPETPQQRLFTLHRYYLTASFMRRRFYEFVRSHPDFVGSDDAGFTEYFAYMSVWYASLWVVLDGWGQMGIESRAVNALLADEQYGKLKDFRDATMHYRPGYIDKKHRRFIADPDSVEWVNNAHRVVGDAILDGLRAFAVAEG